MNKKDNGDKTKPVKSETSIKEWGIENTVYAQEEVIGTYCNNARVSFNNWDASITLGELAGQKDGKLLVFPRVKVTMSLQFVKAFSKLLNENVRRFEEKFGEIQSFEPIEPSKSKK